jgi:hypothetical protein
VQGDELHTRPFYDLLKDCADTLIFGDFEAISHRGFASGVSAGNVLNQSRLFDEHPWRLGIRQGN